MQISLQDGHVFLPTRFHPALYRTPSALPLSLGDASTTNDWWSSYGDDSGTPKPTSTGAKITTGAFAGVTTGFQTALVTGSKLAGGIAGGLAMAAPFAGPAAPFLLVAAGLVGPVYNMFKGCGDTCKEATEIANKAATALTQIKDAYFAQPVRYRSSQVAALYSIEQVAGYINSACSNPQLGAAGQRCISERTVRGGTAPWCPSADHRGCDLWTTVYDPIANDKDVQPDPETAAGGGTGTDVVTGPGQAISVGGFQIPTVLLLGGAALLLLNIVGGDK